jgi:hypothetical protein
MFQPLRFRKQPAAISVLLWAIVVAGACSWSAAAEEAKAEWTVMVFLNADNNLEPFGIKDFLEMAKVGSTAKVNVVVQFDRHPGYTTAYEDWTGTLRFKVAKGMTPVPSQAVEDLGEIDMGSGVALADFVKWSQQTYPAKKYMLVIWDHGQGWRFNAAVAPFQGKNRPLFEEMTGTLPGARGAKKSTQMLPAFRVVNGPVRYVSIDESSGSKLYNRDIQDSLQAYLGTNKLDVIGFDACLMAMIETSYAMRDVARGMVGSEELEPGNGWEYSRWLGKLIADPSADAKALGKIVVQAYRDEYATSDEVTLSAVDLEKVGALADKVTRLATACEQELNAELANIKAARTACANYAPGYGLHGIDLGRLCDQLQMNCASAAIKMRAAEAKTELSGLVLDAFASTDRQGDFGSLGLAIYFPHRKAAYDSDPDGSGYSEANTNYPVQFVQQHRWDNFLHKFFSKVP